MNYKLLFIIGVIILIIIISIPIILSLSKKSPQPPIPIDKCKNINCSGNGTCLDGTCTCDSGFSGSNCDTEDKCVTGNINCSGHGTCSPLDGTCTCDNGFGGSNCEMSIILASGDSSGLVGSNSSSVIYSLNNGKTWNDTNNSTELSMCTKIFKGPNKWLAIGTSRNGNSPILYSNDGINWILCDFINILKETGAIHFQYSYVDNILWNDYGKYKSYVASLVSPKNEASLIYSEDGITWSVCKNYQNDINGTLMSFGSLYKISLCSCKYVLDDPANQPTDNVIIASITDKNDGTIQILFSLSGGNWFTGKSFNIGFGTRFNNDPTYKVLIDSIQYIQDKIFLYGTDAVIDTGCMLYSDDYGFSWKKVNMTCGGLSLGMPSSVTKIVYFKGNLQINPMYIAVGIFNCNKQRSIAVSLDGINWIVQQEADQGYMINDIISSGYNDTTFITTGNGNAKISIANFITKTDYTLNSKTVNGYAVMLGGGNTIFSSDNLCIIGGNMGSNNSGLSMVYSTDNGETFNHTDDYSDTKLKRVLCITN